MMASTLCIIGVGGAGSRVASRAAPLLLGAAHVVAVNTDARELDLADTPVKVLIGATRTGGLGAGGAVATGRLAADDDLTTLRALVSEQTLVVVTAGLGGGTGSGAMPAILRAAHDAGALTLAVVTLPFQFEGPKRQAAAEEALRAVRESADAVVVMANDRLVEEVGETGMKAACERVDAVLGRSLAALCNLIAEPGYIKLDFADLQQMIRQSGGTCAMAYAEASGEDRAEAAAQALLDSTLLERGRLVAQAKALLVGIMGGPDLAVREVGVIMDAIRSKAGAECRTSMGTYIGDDAGGSVQVVLLATETRGDATKPVDKDEGRTTAKAGRRGTRARQTELQGQLVLQPSGRGRFRNVEPTIFDGEDFDIPTYVRRGITIGS
ncbi:MAG: hypothetical protein O3B24_02345 [Verrucomicrobia bacterium]|nr:hypothetical protein [Verrucomicrobiota bacterium]